MKKQKPKIFSSRFDVRSDRVFTFTSSGMIEIRGNEDGTIDVLVRSHNDKWSYRPPTAPPEGYTDGLRLSKQGQIQQGSGPKVNLN